MPRPKGHCDLRFAIRQFTDCSSEAYTSWRNCLISLDSDISTSRERINLLELIFFPSQNFSRGYCTYYKKNIFCTYKHAKHVGACHIGALVHSF